MNNCTVIFKGVKTWLGKQNVEIRIKARGYEDAYNKAVLYSKKNGFKSETISVKPDWGVYWSDDI